MRQIHIGSFSKDEVLALSRMQSQNFILLITGSNGVGKGSLVGTLTALGSIKKIPRVTTREKGKSEIDGKDYHFVSKGVFQKMVEQNAFLDWAEFPIGFYGTEKKDVIEMLCSQTTPLLEMDIEAALATVEVLKEAEIPYKDIFISPVDPSLLETHKGLELALADLQRRMISRNRGENSFIIESRISEARERLPLWRQFRYIVVNRDNQFDNVVKQVKEIIFTPTFYSSNK